MNESKLSTIISGTIDPVENVYKVNSFADAEEIRRMCRIFEISSSQNNKHKMLSIKNVATLKLVLSNN